MAQIEEDESDGCPPEEFAPDDMPVLMMTPITEADLDAGIKLGMEMNRLRRDLAAEKAKNEKALRYLWDAQSIFDEEKHPELDRQYLWGALCELEWALDGTRNLQPPETPAPNSKYLYSKGAPLCPYCGQKASERPDDGDGVTRDCETYEIDCEGCGKEYETEAHVTFDFITDRKEGGA
jgi:hypothetical protein